MKTKASKSTKTITNEVKDFSLEKQIEIANSIIKNVDTVIDKNITGSLSSFQSMIGDLGDLKGKRVLLLQPEKYMTLAVFFSLNGASMVNGLNRFVESEERLSSYYKKLLEFILANKGDIIVQCDMTDDEITKRYNSIVSKDKKKMRSYINRDLVRFSLGEDSSMMPYQDELFDLVILDNVMETLYYPFQSINEIRRVMTKNGLLYMRVNPNGKDIATSAQLAARLKHPRELYEKHFTYKSTDYCNRIQRSDLISHLKNFNLIVDSVKDAGSLKILPFDMKDINTNFMLSGEENISTLSFVLTASKKDRRGDHFSSEDYATYAKGLDLHYKGKYNAASARFESLMKQLSGDSAEQPIRQSKPYHDDRLSRGLFHTLYALMDYEAVVGAYSDIKKADMKQSVEDLYYIAKSHYELEKYGKAKKYLDKARELDPKQHKIFNLIGLCLSKEGDTKEALKFIKHSVKLLPYFSEGLSNIGVILAKLDTKKAIDHFKMVLTIDPTHHGALLNLGRLLYDEGCYDEAGKFLKEYCMVDGAEDSAVKMHIDCLLKLGLKRTAKKEIEDLLEKDPTNSFISNMFNEVVEDMTV